MFNDILTPLEGTKVLATYSTSCYTGILEPFAAYITSPERVEVVLRRKGERKYLSDSDCGIILPLYREHGLGMFAMPDADAPLGFPLSLIPGGRASAGRPVGAMVGNLATMAACSLMLVLPISPDGTGIALYVSAS